MSRKRPAGPPPALMAYLYAINAVQAERVGLTSMANRMRRLARGQSAESRPTERKWYDD